MGRAEEPAIEDAQLKISFHNAAPFEMELWWDPSHGLRDHHRRMLQATVPARGSVDVTTFAGHTFDWVRNERVARRVHVMHGLGTSRFEEEQDASPPAAADSGTVTAAAVSATGNVEAVDGPDCEDRHGDYCVREAAASKCGSAPGWMSVFCARSCGWCHLRHSSARCTRQALNISGAASAWAPAADGRAVRGLAHMFETMAARAAARYPHIEVSMLSEDPPVARFDNFMSDAEIEALVRTAGKFERSTDAGAHNSATGVTSKTMSQGRTSSNAWCRGECENDPLVSRVFTRMEELTGVPRAHYENLQVLRYEAEQRYNKHHDFNPSHGRMPCGPRILTFFLDLSDVEEGGETAFPDLKPPLAVKPRKGSAILWPSVRADDYTQADWRTKHEARPVISGVKLAANAWLHLSDFRMAGHWGCTGSFDEAPAKK
jgi:prolyl 4-hydroxylase